MTSLTRPNAAPNWRAPLSRIDPLEQMERDDRSDWVLLRLVVCAAVATLTLAMASTLPL